MDIDEIVEQYHQKLYKLCLFYLHNEEEAEEILHDIFIKVLKKQSTFKGESNIYTWLYRIAVNTIINHINRKKIVEFISFESAAGHPEITYPSTDGDAVDVDPAVRLEKEEIENLKIEKLEHCIGRLSNREKTAFYFFHFDNLKQKEIATIMKTSVSAVESLIHKAMKKIRKCVKPQEPV
ncbi:MAG: sigma-70 family RNA polymerase sigma factor [Candidatus Aminicenantes bacterium]|nr:sigma-70 family RNA polymerase sigma factor [Candidatus Aminicenantes bacterium]NIM80106.1 sigma-70 family RNA polymerase sigma factor [Candidatus Aminicenantes bacterium]NIN19444.1 sigma-70 family RNA polymerase sigma factor [Candidatus Aminicenantes bacterium]NIN43344.1 sigma-70 family RNA polymerase sigma factor [Candidatus Aminicenantes bacterium]NIN86088.1 sigma-70 family RNA polymerase sigma factor [Candidatus Aminicenantes bacterium]